MGYRIFSQSLASADHDIDTHGQRAQCTSPAISERPRSTLRLTSSRCLCFARILQLQRNENTPHERPRKQESEEPSALGRGRHSPPIRLQPHHRGVIDKFNRFSGP